MAPPKECGSCGIYLVPFSPFGYRIREGRVPFYPPTLQTRAAFSPGLANQFQLHPFSKREQAVGQVRAPYQGNRWKEAKPVWQVHCANTILNGSESETREAQPPCQTTLLGDNSTSCALHTVRSPTTFLSPMTNSTPHGEKFPPNPESDSGPCAAGPHTPNSRTRPLQSPPAALLPAPTMYTLWWDKHLPHVPSCLATLMQKYGFLPKDVYGEG